MNNGISTVERALQLAREGRCRSVSDIKRRLRAEQCERIDEHLSGESFTRQLRAAMKDANAVSQPAGSVVYREPGRAWSGDEIERLRAMRSAGADLPTIARDLERTVFAVQTRPSQMGILKPTRRDL